MLQQQEEVPPFGDSLYTAVKVNHLFEGRTVDHSTEWIV